MGGVWQNGHVYHYGDYHIHVQGTIFAGGMDIDQVISLPRQRHSPTTPRLQTTPTGIKAHRI